jgi:hypothetical protein
VFNSVVQVEVLEVKCVFVVIFIEHPSSKDRHKDAEARREIERRPNCVSHISELDIFAIVWENSL